MASLNKVLLIGNLTADPELKTTASGVSVTTFTIAVQRRFARQQAEGQQTADFVNIVAWRQSAEFVCKYFAKGRPILVCGALQTRTWTDQAKQKHYATEVVADEVGFVDSKGNSGSGAPAPENVGPAEWQEVSGEEDLPF